MPKRDIEKEISTFFAKKNVSLAWRQEYEKSWDRNINYLKSKFWSPEDLMYEDKVAVNLVHPHVRVVVPAVYSKNPDIEVKFRRRDPEMFEILTKRVATIQKLLRYYLKELDMKTEFKLCVLDAVLTGHAWIKTGMEYQFKVYNSQPDSSKNLVDNLLDAIGMNTEEDESVFMNYKITKKTPWCLRTSYKQMIVPAFSRRPEELPWIAEQLILPYQDVMDDPDLNTRGLKPSANANDLLRSLVGASFNPKDFPDCDKEEYVILYNVYYEKDKRMCLIAEDFTEHYLMEEDSPYTNTDSGYHPYDMLRFNEVPDEFYPESDITPAEPQMLELNNLRSAQMNHIKRVSKRKYFSRSSALAEDGKKALRDGIDGSVVEIDQQYSDDPIDSIIGPIQDAPIDPQVFATESRTKDDIWNVLGTTNYASQSSGGANSATEAQIVATQSQFRVEERVDCINEFAGKVVKKLLQICLKNLTQADVIKILGEEDGIFWRQYKNDDDIRREFIADLKYGSTTPVNKANKLERFMQLYAVAQQNPMVFNQLKFSQELLENARDFLSDEPEKYLNPKIAQMLQELMMKQILSGQMPENALGAQGQPQGTPRVPDVGKRKVGDVRGAQASGGMQSKPPRTPGGKGGTAEKVYA